MISLIECKICHNLELEKEYPEVSELWTGKEIQIVRSRNKKYESKQNQKFIELQIQMSDSKGNSLQSVE